MRLSRAARCPLCALDEYRVIWQNAVTSRAPPPLPPSPPSPPPSHTPFLRSASSWQADAADAAGETC